jgi:hypothetical protein
MFVFKPLAPAKILRMWFVTSISYWEGLIKSAGGITDMTKLMQEVLLLSLLEQHVERFHCKEK